MNASERIWFTALSRSQTICVDWHLFVAIFLAVLSLPFKRDAGGARFFVPTSCQSIKPGGHQHRAHPTVCLFWLMLVITGVAVSDEQQMPPMHHLVKVKPSDQITLPEQFPLNDQGQIDCQTCHGLEDIENTPIEEVDTDADDFFREGPYRKLVDFCQRCHTDEQYRPPNIHQLLDSDGNYDEKACEYCHQQAPDPEKPAAEQEINLRLPPEVICLGCHLKTPHLNALNHLVEPDEEMLRRIERSEQELGIILPLDAQGRVMCPTCHNPHQPGVIDERKPAGRQVADSGLDEGVSYQDHPWNRVFSEDKQQRLQQLSQRIGQAFTLEYRRIKTEVLLRLPAKDGSLCLACHVFGEK